LADIIHAINDDDDELLVKYVRLFFTVFHSLSFCLINLFVVVFV